MPARSACFLAAFALAAFLLPAPRSLGDSWADKFVIHPCESMAFLKALEFQRRLKQKRAWETGAFKAGATVSFRSSGGQTVRLKALPSGGLVAAAATVGPEARVEKYGMVLNHAKILGRARLGSSGIIANSAVISEHAIVDGIVCQKGKVYGHAVIGPKIIVHDEAEVFGRTNLSGHFRVGGKRKLSQP